MRMPSRSLRANMPCPPPARMFLFMQKHGESCAAMTPANHGTKSAHLPSDLGFRSPRSPPDDRKRLRRPISKRLGTLTAGGQAAVYRSRTGGNEWKRSPTVCRKRTLTCRNRLRSALAVDSLILRGTISHDRRQVYASADSGDHWAPTSGSSR